MCLCKQTYKVIRDKIVTKNGVIQHHYYLTVCETRTACRIYCHATCNLSVVNDCSLVFIVKLLLELILFDNYFVCSCSTAKSTGMLATASRSCVSIRVTRIFRLEQLELLAHSTHLSQHIYSHCLFRLLFLSIISTAYHLLSGSRPARLLLN